MSFHNTVVCDFCSTHYHLDNQDMDAPPGWLVIKIVVADLDGLLPLEDDEEDNFMHFCSQDCLIQHCTGEKLREQIVMNGKPTQNEDDDDSDEDELPNKDDMEGSSNNE